MKTRLPVSTISYNTDNYLLSKLNDLLKNSVIEWYAFINHMPEDDETKEHKHLYIQPAKSIQTVDIQRYLLEPVENQKPLGCIPFVSSKFADWYLYAIHEKMYLVSKGQYRKYHYLINDIITSDVDYLHEEIKKVDRLKVTPYAEMIDKIKAGLSWEDFVRSGRVPINQYNQFLSVWFCLSQDNDKTDRNGKENHEGKLVFIKPNGEIIDFK